MAKRIDPIRLAVLVAVPLLLVLLAGHNYLLFHSLVELFCIAIGFGIFTLAWSTRDRGPSGYLQFLGVAYLQVACLDCLHMLAYQGMGIFPDTSANPATQLWIGARLVESTGLLLAPVFFTRALKIRLAATLYVLLTIALVAAIFRGSFPRCYVENSGLTLFKIVCEYAIIAILLGAGLYWTRRRACMARRAYRLLMAVIVGTMLAEFFFTTYISVYGISNLIGHLLKLASFYLLYRAVIAYGLQEPYDLLVVREKEIEAALEEIRTLRGILPICMHCKRIRTGDGCWEIVEKYVQDHTHARFSHSLCEECCKKYYD